MTYKASLISRGRWELCPGGAGGGLIHIFHQEKDCITHPALLAVSSREDGYGDGEARGELGQPFTIIGHQGECKGWREAMGV